jgi:trimeric autotransporter adhesin
MFLLLLFVLGVNGDASLISGVVPGVYHSGLLSINLGGQITSASSGVPYNDSIVFSDVTAAAGTTILTLSSPVVQRLIGNNQQVIRLPVSDGLGRVYTFINAAGTGINNALTIQSSIITPIRAVSTYGSTKVATTTGVNQPFGVYATFIGSDFSTLTGQGTTGFTSYGFFAVSSGSGALALGWCTASGQSSICGMANDGVGLVTASGLRSIAMGNGVTASGQDSICLTQYGTCSATNSIYLGHAAGTTSNGLALGTRSSISGGGMIIGYNIISSATNCLGIGQTLTCSGASTVAIGTTASAATSVAIMGTLTGISTVSIGGSSNGTLSVVIGQGAVSTTASVVSIGTGATSTLSNGIALGQSASPFSAAFSLAITTNAASHVPAGLGVTLNGQPAFIQAYGGSFAKTTVSGGTTTLVPASAQYQLFSGTGGQTIVLPNTASLRNGFTFYILNIATGTLTVQDSSLATVTTVATGTAPLSTWASVMVANGGWITNS